ncbi:MAG: NAD(P)-binding domain-containing protein [Ignavibacteriaceae bacterium]|nr:NAD(P)-binding domain-containing protein [Ignavibacteriaceae bacterium]
MQIAIIGAGNVGSALAKQWAKAGHTILLGLRDLNSTDAKELEKFSPNISSHTISEAINNSEVVLFSTPPEAAVTVAKQNPSLKNKIVIDATNSIFKKPEPYKTAFEGIKKETGCQEVVKCFNSTGFENMENPKYGNLVIDMFAASSSKKAKEVARTLSIDAGFAECYDFGGDDKVELLEQFALSWINLAILQKQGRNIAFKVLRK